MTTSLSTDDIERSLKDERVYHSFVLENKLECLLISDPTTEKAAAALNVGIGQYSDSPTLQGQAHFLEHLLFMGTAKYPNENDYNQYLNQHGGASNAWTDVEQTCYYFDVTSQKLEGALDRFAQFFVAPLLKQDAVQRELQAVHSEHEKNLQQDHWRWHQLYKSLGKSTHPNSKFGSGNQTSLGLVDNAELRDKVAQFYQDYYSANLMKLVVYGKESIEELQAWVETYFLDAPNKNYLAPVIAPHPYDANGVLGKYVYQVVPVRESSTLELQFPLREVESLYLSKPTRYLSHLLGHEGKGSILSLLKERQWAQDLSAGESRSATSWSMFGISITLTDLGVEKYQDVVQVIFAYLNMLLEVGPQEWIHDETASVADCSFRFLSKRNPMDYASSLATNMHLYKPRHVLSGPYRIYEYNPESITECLQELVPTNAIILLASKQFEGETTETEKWYGTQYSKVELDAATLAKWSNATVDTDWMVPKLALPERNDLIATNFDLTKDLDLPKEEPTLLVDSASCRLWYKPDNVFEMPKLNFLTLMKTPVAYESPEATVLTSLVQHCLSDHCNEFTYLASMAGLHSSFQATRDGMELHLSGYNHKMVQLMRRLVKAVLEFPTKMQQELFDRIQDKLQKQFANFFVSPPYQHSFYGADLVLLEQKWTTEEKMQALEGVTMQDLMDFYKRLFSRFHLEVLVHGNASPSQAKELTDTLLDGLSPKTPLVLPHQRVVQLVPNQDIIYRFKEYNPENTNSCLSAVYQMGPMDLETNAMLAFLQHVIKEPAFNELRTEEQLGYIVHSSIHTAGANVKGLLILIQSDGYDPIHLDQRVEAFLERFRTKLVQMEPDEFASNIEAVVQNFLEKNKNLGEESSKHWDVIANETYLFTKYQQIAAYVKEFEKVQVLRFFDKYVAKGAPCRSKLSVQVFSQKTENVDDLMTSPLEENGQVLVTDVAEFKRTMPLFPLPDKVAVDDRKTDQYLEASNAE